MVQRHSQRHGKNIKTTLTEDHNCRMKKYLLWNPLGMDYLDHPLILILKIKAWQW
jgi:hypothetical protein